MAKHKRIPTPPKGAKGKSQNTGSFKKGASERDARTTVWNSSLDPTLATVDAYDNLDTTINSLSKFSTTISLESIHSAIRGGLNGLNKITSYLKAANEIRDTLKKGNYVDALGKIAPGAKSALTKAGLDENYFNQFQKAVEVGFKVGDTVKGIKSGNIDVLKGLDDLAYSITGARLGVIEDLQSIKVASAAIIQEFSAAGISLASEWNTLTNRNKDGYQYNYSDDIALMVLPALANNGDYQTILAAINGGDTKRLVSLGEGFIKDLLKNYTRYSPHLVNKKPIDIYKEIIKVIKGLYGDQALWSYNDPVQKKYKYFNEYWFIQASNDFKELAKKVVYEMGDEATLEDKLILYSVATNYQSANQFDQVLNKDFPGFIVNDTASTTTLYSPDAFNK